MWLLVLQITEQFSPVKHSRASTNCYFHSWSVCRLFSWLFYESFRLKNVHQSQRSHLQVATVQNPKRFNFSPQLRSLNQRHGWHFCLKIQKLINYQTSHWLILSGSHLSNLFIDELLQLFSCISFKLSRNCQQLKKQFHHKIHLVAVPELSITSHGLYQQSCSVVMKSEMLFHFFRAL